MTKLTMYIFRSGTGDQQTADQFTDAFNRFVRENDPGWGDVVIAAGVRGEIFHPHRGTVNLYWWWSGAEQDNWLDYYVNHVSVKPQIILCASHKMLDYARARNYKAVYFPGGAGHEYFPMNLSRSGVGYCGTKGHKSKEQERCIIDPAQRYGFQWATFCPGGRSQLNEWYNSKSVCLGMTADDSLEWGVVPTRTYEVLAGANPYITYKHWAMNETLGFEYLYQSSSPEETVHWLEELINNDHKEEFAKFAEIIQREHTWDKRILMLGDAL